MKARSGGLEHRLARGHRAAWKRRAVVVKVGGSLSADPRALRRLMTMLGSLSRRRTLVVVPGGGQFADEVRRADRRFGLADSAAHWMAILAMDQYAHLLAHLAGGRIVRRVMDIEAGRLNVLAPAAWMRRADPLPHSWAVTSDSVAAWVAHRLPARMLVLLKDVDGAFDARPRRGKRGELASRIRRDRLGGVVDAFFPQVLPPRISCWIVNGARPRRVRALLETGRTYGTEVV